MSYINDALETRQNADLLALKGNIHLGLGNTEAFVTYWKKALKKDKDVPLPFSDFIIEELKSQGVLNENLEPNF